MSTHPAVTELAARLHVLGWVSDLWMGGSAASGDYQPGVSDLDLFALTEGPVTHERLTALEAIHHALEETSAAGANLGCAYVASSLIADPAARHPTWTHGRLLERPVSLIARAELIEFGYAVAGREPHALLPAMHREDVRRAARAELMGYWRMATRRPWWWLDPDLADLGLTSMARGRHTLQTGQLLTKTAAIASVNAPAWLRADLSDRRRGRCVRSPRMRTAWIAWRDACRTTATARGWEPNR